MNESKAMLKAAGEQPHLSGGTQQRSNTKASSARHVNTCAADASAS